MARTSPGQFIRQVRQEIGRVTWPTRKEATMSTMVVVVMVMLAAGFFFMVDQFFAWVVKMVLG